MRKNRVNFPKDPGIILENVEIAEKEYMQYAKILDS